MKNRMLKKMLLPIGIGVVAIVLWQILVLNLLENSRISSFTALIMLCLFYVVISSYTGVIIQRIFKRMELIIKQEEGDSIAEKEKVKIEKLKKRDDELGEFVSSIEHSLKSFSDVLFGIKHATDELEVVTGEFNELFGNMSRAIAETDESTASIAENFGNQKKEIQIMQQRVEEISGKIVLIVQQMQNLDLVAENMMEYDETVVRNVEELTELSKQGSQMMQNVKQHALQTNATMQQIGLITEFILGIAKKTNLLALNASIEAARAGEHGKGFAIVAEEIRQLAEQSKEAVDQIDNTIELMKSSANENVQSTEFVSEAFEKQVQKIAETEQMLQRLDVEFARMEEVAKKVGDTVSKLITDKEMINNASAVLIETGMENEQSVEKAVQNMELLKAISGECEEEKDRIIAVSDGLISYISRSEDYIEKPVMERTFF